MRWLIVLAGAGAFFGFANPWLRLPLCALLVPFCLTRIAVGASSGREALKFGFYAGWLAALLPLYWLAIPAHDFGHMPWVLALPLPVLLAAVLGIYPALYCVLLRLAWLRLPGAWFGVYAGSLWVLLELARGWVFTGFPWLPLAGAFAIWPFAIQGSSLVGAYGLSGLFAASAAWLACPKPALLCVPLSLGLLVGLGYFGKLQTGKPLPEGPSLRIGLVQGNVDQAVKWDAAYQTATLEKYLKLTDSIMPDAPALVLWPETALPFFLQDETPLRRKLSDYFKAKALSLLAGSPGYFRRPDGSAALFNRANLINARGELAGYYDKEHLVPFGEYVPLTWLLGPLKENPYFKMFFEGVGDFTPGLRVSPLNIGPLSLGPLICYEVIFPELAQRRVNEGANLLVSISNDAWFGDSAAPLQHQELAQLRAAEQGRYLLRATNTGLSSAIDPRGRVLAQSRLFTEAAFCVEVSLLSERTWFNQAYYIVHFGAAFLAIGLLAYARLRSKTAR